jgi:sodium-type polar flagellar protein MotX
MMKLRIIFLFLLLVAPTFTFSQELEAVQLYSQDELLGLIRTNSHLQRVRQDDCQLVKDIEARADIMQLPAYQYLFGDMLAYAVCVPRNVERGWDLMLQSAAQGLPEGLEQVGRYYHLGRFVQPDMDKAIVYLREASALGNLNAQLRLAKLLASGQGSPVDFEQSYRWLHYAVTANPQQHQQIQQTLAALASKMPTAVVARAKRPIK